MAQNQTTAGPHGASTPRHNGSAEGYYERMEQCVRRNPMSSALAVLGFGMGLGLVLGAVSRGASAARYVPNDVAQRLGHQIIEAMVSVLPESVTSQIEL